MLSSAFAPYFSFNYKFASSNYIEFFSRYTKTFYQSPSYPSTQITLDDARGRTSYSLCKESGAPVKRTPVIPPGSVTALRDARQGRSPCCAFCEFLHPAEKCRRVRNWTVTEKRDSLRRTGAFFEFCHPASPRLIPGEKLLAGNEPDLPFYATLLSAI